MGYDGVSQIHVHDSQSLELQTGNAENSGTSVDRENGHIWHKGKSFITDRGCSIYIYR